MNKAKQLLDELQNLDLDIQSRIDEINELEAGLLSSPKWKTDKVQGGPGRKVDDVYTQLITMKQALEQATNKVVERRTEIIGFIDRLSNPRHRAVLRMAYINKMHLLDICEGLGGVSGSTYSRLKRAAEAELERILNEMTVDDNK